MWGDPGVKLGGGTSRRGWKREGGIWDFWDSDPLPLQPHINIDIQMYMHPLK